MEKYVALGNTCDVLSPSAVFAIFKQLLPASIPSRATIGPPTNRHLRMVVRWRADSGPIVRADWIFYKVIRNMATEKLQVQKVPIEISIPNSTLDAWIQRGLGGPDPTPQSP